MTNSSDAEAFLEDLFDDDELSPSSVDSSSSGMELPDLGNFNTEDTPGAESGQGDFSLPGQLESDFSLPSEDDPEDDEDFLELASLREELREAYGTNDDGGLPAYTFGGAFENFGQSDEDDAEDEVLDEDEDGGFSWDDVADDGDAAVDEDDPFSTVPPEEFEEGTAAPEEENPWDDWGSLDADDDDDETRDEGEDEEDAVVASVSKKSKKSQKAKSKKGEGKKGIFGKLLPDGFMDQVRSELKGGDEDTSRAQEDESSGSGKGGAVLAKAKGLGATVVGLPQRLLTMLLNILGKIPLVGKPFASLAESPLVARSGVVIFVAVVALLVVWIRPGNGGEVHLELPDEGALVLKSVSLSDDGKAYGTIRNEGATLEEHVKVNFVVKASQWWNPISWVRPGVVKSCATEPAVLDIDEERIVSVACDTAGGLAPVVEGSLENE